MPPVNFAMDAGDSLSASDESKFSMANDDNSIFPNGSQGDCLAMHDGYPGW